MRKLFLILLLLPLLGFSQWTLQVDTLYIDNYLVIDNLGARASDTVLVVSNDSVYYKIRGGGYWTQSTDTITTENHVWLDSAFLMNYQDVYMGYWSVFDSAVTMGHINDLGTTLAMIAAGTEDGQQRIVVGTTEGAKSSLIAMEPSFIFIETDSLMITKPPEEDAQYMLVYDATSNEVTVMDTANFVGGSGTVDSVLNIQPSLGLMANPAIGDIQLYDDTLRLYTNNGWEKLF